MNKYNDLWKNQTEIGKMFGISAIKIGKILKENGLKHPKSNHATTTAINEGFAVSQPLKDKTPFFLWNLKKIEPLISKSFIKLSKERIEINKVKEIVNVCNKLVEFGQDKWAWITYDSRYDEVPNNIVKKIRGMAEFELELEQCNNNFDKWINKKLQDLPSIDKEDYDMYCKMISIYYPQYLEKFEILVTFS